MNKKFSVSLTIIFCALLVQTQSAHGQDTPAPSESMWDADPLDVLEPAKKTEPEGPVVPEFKELTEESAPAAPKAEAKPKAAEAAPVEIQDVDAPAAETPAAPAEKPAPAPVVHQDAAPMTTVSGDEPDFSKENRFHSIYKRYNEQPTSDEAWEKVAGARKAETYQVQKGNTLWDISNTFFGDPNYWPKIWSLNNGSISNPHEINPSMMIKFYPGTMADSPTVAVGGADDGEEGAETATKASPDEPAVPPSHRKKTPVLKTLPSSLPSGHLSSFDQPATVELQVQDFRFPAAFEYLSYYVSDVPAAGVGKVTGTEMDTRTAGDYQHIYVQLNQGAEKDYVAHKNMGDLMDPAVKGRKAQMVEVQGSIEVLEKVNEQKNIYRAIVKKAIQPIEVGAVLVPGNLPMIDPKNGQLSASAGAKIMGGQMGKNRGMFSSSSLVFLDGGSSQGFQEGQSFTIYADEALRNRQTDAVMNDRKIGTVKIVKTSPSFSTAYVTTATTDILLGDYVGMASAKTAINKAVPAVESHAPESKEEINHELDLQGAPSTEPAPDSGSEDLDLEL